MLVSLASPLHTGVPVAVVTMTRYASAPLSARQVKRTAADPIEPPSRGVTVTSRRLMGSDDRSVVERPSGRPCGAKIATAMIAAAAAVAIAGTRKLCRACLAGADVAR